MNKSYTLEEIATAVVGTLAVHKSEFSAIKEILTDSRKLIHPTETIFFAITGPKKDGHDYIIDLYQKGVRNFVVNKVPDLKNFPEAGFIIVKDSVVALQKLAEFHRNKFDFPIIAITGSNGKTMVKEWLYQLLHEDFNIVRSPKSYNSQIGVPLSLWQINEDHELGIIEAGISEPGEMQKLAKMIRPSIGLFTNISEAHSEGFLSMRHKTKEKLNLFINVKMLIYCRDYPEINQSIAEINALSKGVNETDSRIRTFTWSLNGEADVNVINVMQKAYQSYISCMYQGKELDFQIPFIDKASVENAIHCACVMLYLGKDVSVIQERVKHLTGIQMRLEMKEAVNNCTLINDSYNSDIGSLKIALDFLKQQQQHPKKTVILSDILQSGRSEVELYLEVAQLMGENKINRLIGIGPSLSRQKRLFEKNANLQWECYESTDDYLKHLDTSSFQDEAILLKGARKFRFEIISRFLERKAHETVLEINLNAIAHNLKAYQSLLKAETKIMAMVKAFSYGSGSFEIANVLQFHRVDYLAVAYADEGVELRKNGITLPIMVMNPEWHSFETMIQYNLEPEIYSFALLERFSEVLMLFGNGLSNKIKIHIELETGMNRLGFEEHEIPSLLKKLSENHFVEVASVFSHLVASEDKSQDEFTKLQMEKFDSMSRTLCVAFDYKILRHILNSSGISRHQEGQLDMVRLGIGLYGIDASEKIKGKLMTVSTLKTTISQIKKVRKGDTVGYGRVGKVSEDKTIATVGIGYADGLIRSLSNGNGKMLVGKHLAPIIGNVCMDMTMLDITGIDAKEGDEVIIFGTGLPIEEVAKAAGTISYDILTGISARVKRIYFQE
ncbi:MAG: bifunctional UDP-N-acetylmuramoyl-tripeptide:D-alanyl-D-alanine ligase/alanine racemase [Bacteroidetes bacterium]|nr:bifunctional UDP-N-acetylmuramoyl-tripeptide:D-alanyl-D-alanine ligase/alanine racemase [Bacteroidota bacterium]